MASPEQDWQEAKEAKQLAKDVADGKHMFTYIREHVKLGHEIGETTLARDLDRNAVNVRRALLAYCRSQRPKMTPRLINNGQGFWGWC